MVHKEEFRAFLISGNRVSHVSLLPALPDAGHVHLVPAEDVKLIIIKHVGSVVQNIWKLLLHWPERTEDKLCSNKAASLQI